MAATEQKGRTFLYENVPCEPEWKGALGFVGAVLLSLLEWPIFLVLGIGLAMLAFMIPFIGWILGLLLILAGLFSPFASVAERLKARAVTCPVCTARIRFQTDVHGRCPESETPFRWIDGKLIARVDPGLRATLANRGPDLDDALRRLKVQGP